MGGRAKLIKERELDDLRISDAMRSARRKTDILSCNTGESGSTPKLPYCERVAHQTLDIAAKNLCHSCVRGRTMEPAPEQKISKHRLLRM